MIDMIKSLPKNKLLVINVNNDEDRKLIHQYLENNVTTRKASMCCDCFDTNTRMRFLKKCYHCNKKNVMLNKYNYGDMENNQDEYWSGECPKCYEYNYYEPNYDDNENIWRTYENNCIVINVNYSLPSHAKINKEVTLDEFNNTVNKYNHYVIDQPDDMRIKRNVLEKYISDTIKKIEIIFLT